MKVACGGSGSRSIGAGAGIVNAITRPVPTLDIRPVSPLDVRPVDALVSCIDIDIGTTHMPHIRVPYTVLIGLHSPW